MKKLIVLLFMILPLGVVAQEVKIAYVKTQEVFMAMPEVSDMEKQMADLNEKYKKELEQMQEEYGLLDREYQIEKNAGDPGHPGPYG